MPAPAPVDIAQILDRGSWTTYQRTLVFLTALTIVFDGIDNQLIGVAVPTMMREWDVPRGAFAPVISGGYFGMMIGGALAGLAGDRFGRRVALFASTALFGVMTLVVAAVDDVHALAMVRFITGIGLGGAMPNAAALVAEFAPRRHRPLAITATIVCIPLGGFLGGVLAGQIIPVYGWRALFVIGGLAPAVLALSLLKVLPESPGYLAAPPQSRGSMAALFAPDLRRDTTSLILAFMSCLLAIWMGFLWIPAMLTDAAVGFTQPDASYALSLFNFGGVGGALVGAIVIQRFGSRPTLLGMTGLALMAALMMAALPPHRDAFFRTMMLFAVTGALMNAVQSTMYALAAHVFPTSIRGTGVGTTVAIGRIGNVLASYVGSWALAAGVPPRIVVTWAVARASVFASLARFRRHIPRS